jgi:hypothetical protein
MTGEGVGVFIVLQSISTWWPFAVAISSVVQTLAITLMGHAQGDSFSTVPLQHEAGSKPRQLAASSKALADSQQTAMSLYCRRRNSSCFFFVLTYKGCKWKRTSGRVKNQINVNGVIEHSPITMIYIPGVLQQLQGQWNPCGSKMKENKWKTLF